MRLNLTRKTKSMNVKLLANEIGFNISYNIKTYHYLD